MAIRIAALAAAPHAQSACHWGTVLLRHSRSALLLAGLFCLADAGAAAYRCQDADGKLTYSDRPCEVNQQAAGRLDRSGQHIPARAEPVAATAPANARAPAAPAFDVGKPGPGHVLTACKVLVVQCVSSPSKTFDGCLASAPRCTSTQPWLDEIGRAHV